MREYCGNGCVVVACIIVLLSPMMLSISTWALLFDNPQFDDVLLVTVGHDDATSTAKGIIEHGMVLREEGSHKELVVKNPMMAPTQPIAQIKEKYQITTKSISLSANSFDNEIKNHRAWIVVVIGHGSEYGIESLSWDEILSGIRQIQAVRVIFTACHSSEISKKINGGFGFGGSVDARTAAYFSSALVLAAFDGYSNLVKAHLSAGLQYGLKVSSGEIPSMPLGEWPEWWNPWKLVFIALLTTVFYAISPVTAPKTLAECVILATGVTGLAIIIAGLSAFIYYLAGFIKPILPPEWKGIMELLQDYAGTIAGLIAGGIAAYVSGASYPGLMNFLRNIYALWTGRAAAEAATAANPEPVSRGLLAVSAATLCVTAIEVIINFGLSTPPPPSATGGGGIAPSPPSGGGGGTGPKDAMF